MAAGGFGLAPQPLDILFPFVGSFGVLRLLIVPRAAPAAASGGRCRERSMGIRRHQRRNRANGQAHQVLLDKHFARSIGWSG
jgi:hypothetical protein